MKILYIEDSPSNRLLVRRVLIAEGYEVLEAGDGIRGLELARQEHPDLILMDINYSKNSLIKQHLMILIQ